MRKHCPAALAPCRIESRKWRRCRIHSDAGSAPPKSGVEPSVGARQTSRIRPKNGVHCTRLTIPTCWAAGSFGKTPQSEKSRLAQLLVLSPFRIAHFAGKLRFYPLDFLWNLRRIFHGRFNRVEEPPRVRTKGSCRRRPSQLGSHDALGSARSLAVQSGVSRDRESHQPNTSDGTKSQSFDELRIDPGLLPTDP